jgi:hypothetical protein
MTVTFAEKGRAFVIIKKQAMPIKHSSLFCHLASDETLLFSSRVPRFFFPKNIFEYFSA